MGLVGPWHVGYSWIKDWTRVSCIVRWILDRWASRSAMFNFCRTALLFSGAAAFGDAMLYFSFWPWLSGCHFLLLTSKVTSRRNVSPSLCSGTLLASLNDTFLIGMPGPCHLAPASCWLQASEHILYQTRPVINRCLYCTINSVRFNKFPVVLTQSPFSPYLTPLCQAFYNLCVCSSVLLSAPSKFPLSHQVTVAFGSHLNITFSVWNSFSFPRPTLLSPEPSISRFPTCSNLSRSGPCHL